MLLLWLTLLWYSLAPSCGNHIHYNMLKDELWKKTLPRHETSLVGSGFSCTSSSPTCLLIFVSADFSARCWIWCSTDWQTEGGFRSFPPLSHWQRPNFLLPCSVLVCGTGIGCRPSLSGYSWSAKVPKKWKINQPSHFQLNTTSNTETIWLEQICCFLSFQNHFFWENKNVFLFLCLFIFSYCEVKMDRSSVNVAKRKTTKYWCQ